MEKEVKCKIDWKTADNMLKFDVEYDDASDTLFMKSKADRPAVSVDCGGEYWLRVDPKTGEILGIEIEGFKKVFLKRHPRLVRGNTVYVRPIADFIQIEKCLA